MWFSFLSVFFFPHSHYWAVSRPFHYDDFKKIFLCHFFDDFPSLFWNTRLSGLMGWDVGLRRYRLLLLPTLFSSPVVCLVSKSSNSLNIFFSCILLVVFGYRICPIFWECVVFLSLSWHFLFLQNCLYFFKVSFWLPVSDIRRFFPMFGDFVHYRQWKQVPSLFPEAHTILSICILARNWTLATSSCKQDHKMYSVSWRYYDLKGNWGLIAAKEGGRRC